MNKLFHLFLRSSLSALLADRDAFTEKVAGMIEQKMGNDPEAAQKLSDYLVTAMDSINDQLLMDQLFNLPSDHQVLEEKIDKLTTSIDRLNDNLEKIMGHGMG